MKKKLNKLLNKTILNDIFIMEMVFFYWTSYHYLHQFQDEFILWIVFFRYHSNSF